jgi:D-glycero-D-manno-heptose 1,7-bisphosphate phosphatase
MLLEAARRYDIDLENSIIIGDKLADIEAGKAAGCRSILVRTGYGINEEHQIGQETEVYDDLLSAVKSLH